MSFSLFSSPQNSSKVGPNSPELSSIYPDQTQLQPVLEDVKKNLKLVKKQIKINDISNKRLDNTAMMQLFNFNTNILKKKVSRIAMKIFKKKERPLKFNQKVMGKLKMSAVLQREQGIGCYKLIRDVTMTEKFVKEILKKLMSMEKKDNFFEETEKVMKEYAKTLKEGKGSSVRKIVFADGTTYVVVDKNKNEIKEKVRNKMDDFLDKFKMTMEEKVSVDLTADYKAHKSFKRKLVRMKKDFMEMCRKKEFVVFQFVKRHPGSNRRRNKSHRQKSGRITSKHKHSKSISYAKQTLSQRERVESKFTNLVFRKDPSVVKKLSKLNSRKRRPCDFQSIQLIKNETREQITHFFNQKAAKSSRRKITKLDLSKSRINRRLSTPHYFTGSAQSEQDSSAQGSELPHLDLKNQPSIKLKKKLSRQSTLNGNNSSIFKKMADSERERNVSTARLQTKSNFLQEMLSFKGEGDGEGVKEDSTGIEIFGLSPLLKKKKNRAKTKESGGMFAAAKNNVSLQMIRSFIEGPKRLVKKRNRRRYRRSTNNLA